MRYLVSGWNRSTGFQHLDFHSCGEEMGRVQHFVQLEFYGPVDLLSVSKMS